MQFLRSPLFLFLALFLGSFSLTSAHTWLDCVKMTPNGCQGYIRGYPGRLPGVDVDRLTTYKILGRPSSVPICFPGRQSTPDTYSSMFPMAVASPGDELVFTYTENGHVTKDKIPPNNSPNPKTYTIHWNGATGSPGPQITDRNQLGSSTLLKEPTSFDDGVCGEPGPPLFRNSQPCRGSFKIPTGTPPGVYQFVWYWVFDKIPDAGGEEYTSCFDVRVVARDDGPRPAPTPKIAAPTPKPVFTRPAPSPTPVPSGAPNPSDQAGASCDKCTRSASANPDTGVGYQYYLASCLNGGLGCVGSSGCRMCTTKPWKNRGDVQCPSCVYQTFNLPQNLAQGLDANDTSHEDDTPPPLTSTPTTPKSPAAHLGVAVAGLFALVLFQLLF